MGYPMLGGLTNLWDGHLDDLVVNGIGEGTILQKTGNELVGYFPKKDLYLNNGFPSFNGVFLEVLTKSGLVETYAMESWINSVTKKFLFDLPPGLWEALTTRMDVSLVSLYTRFVKRGDVFTNTLMETNGDSVASFKAGTVFRNETDAPRSVASFDDGSFTNFAKGAQFAFLGNNGDAEWTRLYYYGPKTGWKLFTPNGIYSSSLEDAMVAPGSPLYFSPKYASSEAAALALEDVAEASDEERPALIQVRR